MGQKGDEFVGSTQATNVVVQAFDESNLDMKTYSLDKQTTWHIRGKQIIYNTMSTLLGVDVP